MCAIAQVFLTSATWSSPSKCSFRLANEIRLNVFSFRGKTATEFLEWLTPSSLSALKPYASTLTVLLNDKGGIIDDTIVTKHAGDAFYVVTNAGRREEDLAWFKERLAEWNSSERGKNGPVEHEVLEGWGLLALQGNQKLSFDAQPLTVPFRTPGGIVLAKPDIVRSQTTHLWYICLCSH